MLTCWTVCHRSLCGRIFESKNISCSVVESAGCASDRRRGRGGACEAAARGCRRSVPAACSARRCLARKSPEHALCCCTCVSSRVSLGGFHNYIVINSNARDLRPGNSRSTLEFPEIAPSDLSARHAGCAERNGHGDGSSVRLVDRASTVSSYGMGAAYQGSNSPEPAADTHLRPISALGGHQIEPSSTPWEAFLAAGRPAWGLLSVGRLTRHHVVLGTSLSPRGVTLSRPVYRKTDALLTRSAAQR